MQPGMLKNRLLLSAVGSNPVMPHDEPPQRRCVHGSLIGFIGFQARQTDRPWRNSACRTRLSGNTPDFQVSAFWFQLQLIEDLLDQHRVFDAAVRRIGDDFHGAAAATSGHDLIDS